MNFLKRGVLSVKTRFGKSLLLIFVFSVICVLVLTGLSIQSAAKKTSDLARMKLGADVTLQLDMDKVRGQMVARRQSNQPIRFQPTPVPVESAKELTTYEQIKGYNFYSSAIGQATDFAPIENESSESEETTNQQGPGGNIRMGGMMPGDVTLQGVAFTDSVEEFMNETASLVEGRHLTDADIGNNVTIIEQTLAEENGLVVGDHVTVTNPGDESLSLQLEVVGIYKTTATGSELPMNVTAMIPYNKLYVPYTTPTTIKGADFEGTIDRAIYYIDDPAHMQSFIDEANANSTIDFNTFKLDANDQLYKQMVGPIENVASFFNHVVYLVSIAGAIILGLIVMMSIRERKYEMGVLLALGEKRWKLAGQFVFELLLVAVLSLGIASASGNVIAKQIGDTLLSMELQETEQTSPDSFGGPRMVFGGPAFSHSPFLQVDAIDELDVSVSYEDLGKLSFIGMLIAILSALLPSLAILRMHPRMILSKQD